MTNIFVKFRKSIVNSNQLKIERQLYFTANTKQDLKVYLISRDVKHEYSYISESINWFWKVAIMKINILIILLCLIINFSYSIYIFRTKNINIIASIEADKVPKHKVNRLVKLFICCLTCATFIIICSILVIEQNLILSMCLVFLSFIVLSIIYIYYLMIKK